MSADHAERFAGLDLLSTKCPRTCSLLNSSIRNHSWATSGWRAVEIVVVAHLEIPIAWQVEVEVRFEVDPVPSWDRETGVNDEAGDQVGETQLLC